MPYYTKDETGIFFWHIPKTAGTSIKNLLLRNGFEEFSKDPQVKHHSVPEEPALKKLLNEIKIDFSFAFFRHPLERIFSAFRWGGYWISNRTENDFYNYLDNVMRSVKKQRGIHHNHIRPQTDFFTENTNVYLFGEWNSLIEDLNKVTKLENFELKQDNSGHLTQIIEGKKIKIDYFPSNQEKLRELNDFYRLDYEFYERIKEEKFIKLSKKDIELYKS
jgi:hypothetical protein